MDMKEAHFDDPVAAFPRTPDTATLAFVADIEGQSYPPLGAPMRILDKHHWVGTVTCHRLSELH